MLRRHPMDRRFHFAAVRCVAAARIRVIRAVNLHHVASIILDHAGAFHQVGIAQPHFVTRKQPEVLGRRRLAEIILFDIEHSGKGYRARTCRWILGIVDRLHLFHQVVRVIVDDQLERIEHSHAALGNFIQMIAHHCLKLRHFHPAIVLRLAQASNKIDNCAGWHAPPAQAAQRGQAGIIPAAHHAGFDQLAKFTLAHHRVGQVEP